MLAFITSYWFITLPTVITGAYLFKAWKKAVEEKEQQTRKERVRVRSQHRQDYPQHPH